MYTLGIKPNNPLDVKEPRCDSAGINSESDKAVATSVDNCLC